MKQIKISEATGPVLDWLVAKCEGVKVEQLMGLPLWSSANWKQYSTDWSQAGPLIEREGISQRRVNAVEDDEVDANMHHWWCAADSRRTLEGYSGLKDDTDLHWGPTPLIAAMRCYVTSKLGDTVEVPEELTDPNKDQDAATKVRQALYSGNVSEAKEWCGQIGDDCLRQAMKEVIDDYEGGS